MDYAKGLPATGGGILFGGMVLSQAWLLMTALLVVVAAALTIRFVWRRNKSINEI